MEQTVKAANNQAVTDGCHKLPMNASKVDLTLCFLEKISKFH